MAYELHIERLGKDKDGETIPITLEEWKSAVAATPGVRLCAPGIRTVTMPDGASLNLPVGDGDVEVSFPDEQAWQAVFRWHAGAASFNGRFSTPGIVRTRRGQRRLRSLRVWEPRFAETMERVTICRQERLSIPNTILGRNKDAPDSQKPKFLTALAQVLRSGPGK